MKKLQFKTVKDLQKHNEKIANKVGDSLNRKVTPSVKKRVANLMTTLTVIYNANTKGKFSPNTLQVSKNLKLSWAATSARIKTLLKLKMLKKNKEGGLTVIK